MSLFGPEEVIRAEVERCLRAAGPRGHILNVGHGVVQVSGALRHVCIGKIAAWQFVHQEQQAPGLGGLSLRLAVALKFLAMYRPCRPGPVPWPAIA